MIIVDRQKINEILLFSLAFFDCYLTKYELSLSFSYKSIIY